MVRDLFAVFDNAVSVIIDALLRANQDGQDIVTLSLGGADGWTASASSVVASRIARNGKIVTIAAGNDVRLLPSSLLAPPCSHKGRVLPALGIPLVQGTASTLFLWAALRSTLSLSSILYDRED